MSSGEAQLIEWLSSQAGLGGQGRPHVTLGIGDDMAAVRCPAGDVLFSSDMLLDGVHFRRETDPLELIGRKAIACGLSDCAAMGVGPMAATVSLALPFGWRLEDSQRLYAGMKAIAQEFECGIVGGDTTAWNQRLAIDVAIIALPFRGIRPRRRDGAQVGDALFATGPLGGSGLGRHLTFTPRVAEAQRILETFGDAIHAMMDISDGLSLDLHRLCEASGVGATLEEALLRQVIHPDAQELAQRDGQPPLGHVLSDGEDFELLLAVDSAATDVRCGVDLHRVGTVTSSGMRLRRADGGEEPLARMGFEHSP